MLSFQELRFYENLLKICYLKTQSCPLSAGSHAHTQCGHIAERSAPTPLEIHPMFYLFFHSLLLFSLSGRLWEMTDGWRGRGSRGRRKRREEQSLRYVFSFLFFLPLCFFFGSFCIETKLKFPSAIC